MSIEQIHILVRRIEVQCSSALGQISRATSVAQVLRAADIPVPGHLRSLVRASTSRVTAAAERRLDQLMDEQTVGWEALPPESRLERAGQLRREWQGLPGRFPRQAHRAAQFLQRR